MHHNLPITDVMEGKALVYGLDFFDIYSNSWGPSDTGEDFDALPYPGVEALKEGVTKV